MMDVPTHFPWFSIATVWNGRLVDGLIGLGNGTTAICLIQAGRRIVRLPEMRRYRPFVISGITFSIAGFVFRIVQAVTAAKATAFNATVWESIFALSAIPLLFSFFIRASRILRVNHNTAITLDDAASYRALGRAVDGAQMVLEIDMNGMVLKANENCVRCFGYTEEEVRGLDLRMLVPVEEVTTGAYERFLQELRQGNHQSGTYRWLTKGGETVWTEATYHPCARWKWRSGESDRPVGRHLASGAL